MAKAFAEITARKKRKARHHEWLGLLLDARRHGGRQKADQSIALRPTTPASLHRECRLSHPRGLDRALFQSSLRRWIEAPIICACRSDRRRQKLAGVGDRHKPAATIVRSSTPCAQALRDLALARGDGRHPRILRPLGRADLLILDDWDWTLDAAARHDLLEILEEQYGRCSTVITSQLPVDRWHEIIGDPLTPTPSWTASFITPIASNLPAKACAGPEGSRTKGLTNVIAMTEIHRPARLATGRHIPLRWRHHPGIPGGIIPLYPAASSESALRFRQGQTQVGDIPQIIGLTISMTSVPCDCPSPFASTNRKTQRIHNPRRQIADGSQYFIVHTPSSRQSPPTPARKLVAC